MSDANGDRLDETVGIKGAKVRVKELKSGKVVLLYPKRHRDPNKSGYDREPLDFRLRNGDGERIPEAEQQALDEAWNLSKLLNQGRLPEDLEPAPEVRVGELFDLFRAHELPNKSEQRQSELRRHLDGLERFLGRGMKVRDFGPYQWNQYTRERMSGAIDVRGRRVPEEKRREVSGTTAGYDLAVLRQVCRWGESVRPEDLGIKRRLPGDRRFLLLEDPTRNDRCQRPRSKNPARPVCSDARFKALLGVADEVRVGHGEEKVRPPLRELLILARGTGRRIGAILALRWDDWDPDAHTYGELRWRAEEDKIDREWRAPVTKAVRNALEGLYARCLAESGVPGPETLLFPALEVDGTVRVDVARQWLLEAEELAGLDHPRGFGWHAFRRAWATARKDLPSQDVAAAGGWADTQALHLCYQHADPETTEQVVLHEDPLPEEDGEEGQGKEAVEVD